MRETPPTPDPQGRYSVKAAVIMLGTCHKVFQKLRRAGLIEPINPDNKSRPKFSGQSIIDCWDKATKL